MRFANPEGVASGLEEGLEEVRFVVTLPEKSLRLRYGSCGHISTALQQCLSELGYETRLAITEPKLKYDKGMQHVVTIATVNGCEYVVDGSYTQFLRYAGLSPHYVQRGGDNVFPAEKIAIFPLGEHEPIAESLATTALSFMAGHKEVEVKRPITGRYEFEKIDPSQVYSDLLRIWDPDAMKPYTPSTKLVHEAGRIAAHVHASDAVLLGP